MDRFSKITDETKYAQADVDAAHAVIRAHMKANGYVKHTKSTWGRWDGKHAFNTAMWLGVGTVATIVTPWAMFAFPILGMLSEHYNSKDRN